MSNEELLAEGECPEPNCIEVDGHTGPHSYEEPRQKHPHKFVENCPGQEGCWWCGLPESDAVHLLTVLDLLLGNGVMRDDRVEEAS